LIGTIQAGTPAEEAGFKHGDVVLVFDGKPIKNFGELSAYVADTDVGKVCDVIIWRDNKEQTLKVKIGLLPDSGQTLSSSGSTPQDLGISVREITPDIARSLGIDPPMGLLVENVLPESPAAQSGIRPRDVILEIDKTRINTISDYQRVLSAHDKSSPFIFFIRRGEGNIYVTVDVS
jgi:serine protease Do